MGCFPEMYYDPNSQQSVIGELSSKILIVIRHDVWTDQILMTHYKVERFNSI